MEKKILKFQGQIFLSLSFFFAYSLFMPSAKALARVHRSLNPFTSTLSPVVCVSQFELCQKLLFICFALRRSSFCCCFSSLFLNCISATFLAISRIKEIHVIVNYLSKFPSMENARSNKNVYLNRNSINPENCMFANSVSPGQTAPRKSIIRVYNIFQK